MDHVCVIEGIMGSGKSSAVINQILKNPKEKMMIIVNYIKEGERYSERLKTKNFTLIGNIIKNSKTADLKRALENQENIICTKFLFKMNMNLIKEYVSDYVLIIDEAMNDIVETYKFPSLYILARGEKDEIKKLDTNKKLKEYSITEKDIRIMLENKILLKETESGKLSWNNELQESSIYDIIKEDFSTYDIYEFQNNYVKVMPIEIFKSFKRIFILTYMWNTQIMRYYFEMHGIKNFHIEFPLMNDYKKLAEKVQVDETNQNDNKTKEFSLTQKEWEYLEYADILKEKAREHIFIEDKGEKWTYIDENGREINLSYSFYLNDAKKLEYTSVVKRLKLNINNCIKNNELFPNRASRKEMWTIYKDAIEVITDKEYGDVSVRVLNEDNFVSFNKIATNEYSDKNTLFYLIDRYKNPFIKSFIEAKAKTDFDEDGFALSELIQWVWRSAIRNNQDIYLYIASERMNKMFNEWLNTEEKTSTGLSEILRETSKNSWTNFVKK